MNRLSPKVHGMLDYVTVILLALSPSLFNMRGYATIFTWSLAFVHLMLTLFTNFKMGMFPVIPLRIHGIIEIWVSVLLVVVSFLFLMYSDVVSFYFYLIFAIVLFFVWLISDYSFG